MAAPGGVVRILPSAPAPAVPNNCVLYSWCRGTTRELKPKSPADPTYAATATKVNEIWTRSVAMIQKHPIATLNGGARNVQVNFSKCYISFEDANGREYRLNMHTRLSEPLYAPADRDELTDLMTEISHTGKELASYFKRPQNNPEASFAVTSSPEWDAIRSRTHEEFRAKGQERALIHQITSQAGPADAVATARQRIENTGQFMTKLAEKLEAQRKEFEKALKEMDKLEPPLPRNHPDRLELQKQIANIQQLETMLASVDKKGTRDAIYWAVGIGGEIDDTDPNLVGILAETSAKIARHMETALKRPLSPEDTRGDIEKRLPINKPPTYILNGNSVNTPYLTAYAQDAGNLIYSDESIESFIVHCAMRMGNNGGNNLDGALDALGIPFATDAAGKSEIKKWMIDTIQKTIQEIRDNPPDLPPPLPHAV